MGKWFRRIVMAILAAVFLGSLISLVSYKLQAKRGDALYAEASAQYVRPAQTPEPTPAPTETPEPEGSARETAPPEPEPEPHVPEYAPIEVDFDSLRSVNSDVVGWIWCEGTVIDYPVLQGTDNNDYLHHTYDGKYLNRGSIFVEAKNRRGFVDANIIIYGHHMQSGAMFAILEYWASQSYYDEHPIMWLLTPTQDYKIVLVSGYATSAYSDTYEIISEPGREMDSYIYNAVRRSDFQADFIPAAGARYVLLTTCAYFFEDARYVLHGMLVPVDSAGGVPIT